MSVPEPDHYERLGVERDAAAAELAKAYRRAARLTHPDAGGSDEDFAAVAEAYRVLGDPDLRATYDRELDGVGADWDDVGWGADVGPATQAEPDAGGNDLPPEPPETMEGDDPAQDSPPGPVPGCVLHPFLGPPRRIPDPLSEPRPQKPVVRPGMRERVASIMCWVLLVAAFALQVRVGNQLSGRGGVPDDLDERMLAPLVTGLVAVAVHSASARKSDGVIWAWFLTAGAVASTGSYLSGLLERPDRALIGVAALSLATLASGVTWAISFRGRRADPELQRWERETHPGWLADRYHRAVEWNRVRTAMQQAGTVAVILGYLADDHPGYAGMSSRWTFEPLTGREAVRVVPDDAPQGSWLVLDDEGDVIASAPAGAPEAWVSALTPT